MATGEQTFKFVPAKTQSARTFRVHVQVRHPEAHAGVVCGNAVQVDVSVNVPPQSGAMLVHPQQGEAVIDKFQLSHHFPWVDEHLPLRYTFGYTVGHFDADSGMTMLNDPALYTSNFEVGFGFSLC